MSRGPVTQLEMPNQGGEFTHITGAALLVTVGAVAIGGYLKHKTPGDERVMDYAKNRAQMLFDQAKPVAGRVLDSFRSFLRTHLSEFLSVDQTIDDEMVSPSPAQAQFVTSTATGGKISNVITQAVVAVPEVPVHKEPQLVIAAELAEPETTVKPEPLSLTEIFADADSLLNAYNGGENQAELSNETRAGLEDLLRAYRLIEAVPQAAQIWAEYIGPQVEQLKNNNGDIIAAAEELEAIVIQFRVPIVRALIRLKAGNSEAYETYDTQVRTRDQESPNRRAVFDASATSYAATMRTVVQMGQETALGELPTPVIAHLMTDFVAKSSVATLYPDEAKKLWDMVVLGDDEDITPNGIADISESLEQQATSSEKGLAAKRRAKLREFLPYIEAFQRQSDSISIIDAVSAQLTELDQAADQGYFVNKTVEPIFDQIGLKLLKLQKTLNEDIEAESEFMSEIDKLAMLL